MWQPCVPCSMWQGCCAAPPTAAVGAPVPCSMWQPCVACSSRSERADPQPLNRQRLDEWILTACLAVCCGLPQMSELRASIIELQGDVVRASSSNSPRFIALSPPIPILSIFSWKIQYAGWREPFQCSETEEGICGVPFLVRALATRAVAPRSLSGLITRQSVNL
jgi:hypothetical protein